MKYDISVVLPTFMPQSYIFECLDSLVNQSLSRSRYQVIVVLNGPKYPYFQILDKYICSHKDYHVLLLYTEVVGVSNARNIALEISEGEYITFIDDDDYVSNSYLEDLYNKASHDTVSLSYAKSFLNDDNRYFDYYVTKNFVENTKISSINKVRSYFSGPVYKLIHRDIIKNVRFNTRLKNGEDTLFMFEISCNISYFYHTSKDAIYYRRIRYSSANFRKRKFRERLISNSIQLREYLRLYMNNPRGYNLLFTISRCLGAIVGILPVNQT